MPFVQNGIKPRHIREPKLRLRSVVPQRGLRLLYCDYVECDGEGLFRLALMPYTFAPRVISGRWMGKVATIPF
jgi:hypothetical protein